MTDPDETLVKDARAGDRAAFEELVRRTSRLVFARLYLETGHRHQAEDLLQETLLTAFRSLKGLADARSFRPWLLKIAQNTAIDAARRDQRQKRAAPSSANKAGLHDVPANGLRPEEHLEHKELRERVLAILRLSPRRVPAALDAALHRRRGL